MNGHQFVRDVGDGDFDEQVIALSHEVPVVVDFWAEWCGPCRALGPLLESEVEALGGRVRLAKVDTDAAPETAGRYRVTSIPMVVAFDRGEAVDTFVGAQPAAVVRAFLARLAPSAEQQDLRRAQQARDAGRIDEARALLAPLVGSTDAGVRTPAALLLARIALEAGAPAEAESALTHVDPRHEDAPQAETLRQLAALAQEAVAYGGEEKAEQALSHDAGDLDARFALAAALASSGRPEQALEHLLHIVSRSRRYRNDIARRTLLSLFEYLGPESDLVRESRRRLQVLL